MADAQEGNMETGLHKPNLTALQDVPLTSADCNTQTYFDRDVEIVICQENRQCEFRRSYNNLQICTNPAASLSS